MSTMDRRAFLRLSGASAIFGPSVLTLLAGCGDNGSSSGGEAPSTIVYGVPALAEGLDREFFISGPSLEAIGNTFEPITMWKRESFENGSFVPRFDTDTWDTNLLDDLEVSQDGKTWTFRFKRGIMSHSGNELTAADYHYALARHEELWSLGSFYNVVARIPRFRHAFQTVDKYTIRVSTETPSPTYLRLLENTWAMGPFDSIEAKKHATDDDPWSKKWMKSNGAEAGHGAYTIETYSPGTEIVYAAFADYHRGKPAVQKVIQREIASSASRVSLLESGDIQMTRDLLPVEFEKLAATPGIAVDNFSSSRSRILFLMFQLDKKPFNNPQVRQALAYAAPYSEIVTDVYRGFASEWRGIISRDYPYFTDEPWKYGSGGDVARAKSLLSDAGYRNGFRSELLYNASEPDMELVAIQLQSAFDKVGVHLELVKLAAASFTERYTGKQFSTLLVNELALTPDIGYACYLWYRSDAFVNVMNYKSDRADSLIDDILSTLDEGERESAAKELQALIIEDSPALFLAQPHYVVARRDNLSGVTGYTSRTMRFADLRRS